MENKFNIQCLNRKSIKSLKSDLLFCTQSKHNSMSQLATHWLRNSGLINKIESKAGIGNNINLDSEFQNFK